MENIETVCKEKVTELLDNLSIKFNDLNITFDKENKMLNVQILGDDLGILIGYHGKNLQSIKTLVSLMINKEIDKEESLRVNIDVNDYAAKRVEQLKNMLENAKLVMTAREKDSYSFPPMNPADRRILHTLAQEMGLKTESEGEGFNRHVNLIK